MINRMMERIRRKRLAYRNTLCDERGLPHVNAVIVLADLRRFCGINKGGIVVSPISRTVDPHATMYRAGQRDVYLRIAAMIGLDEDTHIGDNDGGSSGE